MRLDGVTWVLMHQGEVLLERCEKKARVLGVGTWFVPGGKLEEQDYGSPLNALKREIAEEWPSVTLTHYDELPVIEGSRVPYDGVNRVFLMRPYRVQIAGDPRSLTQSSEGTPLRWFPALYVLTNSPVVQVRMMVAAALWRGGGEL